MKDCLQIHEIFGTPPFYVVAFLYIFLVDILKKWINLKYSLVYVVVVVWLIKEGSGWNIEKHKQDQSK